MVVWSWRLCHCGSEVKRTASATIACLPRECHSAATTQNMSDENMRGSPLIECKSNRFSNDSGVVCLNSVTVDRERLDLEQEYMDQERLESATPAQDMGEYKSVYNRPTSYDGPISLIGINSSDLKGNKSRVMKKNSRNKEQSSGGSIEQVRSLTHVQQMRLKFESLCLINSERRIGCANSDCKSEFASLPVIPIPIPTPTYEDESPWTEAESPIVESGEVVEIGEDTETPLACDCEGGKDKEDFRENDQSFDGEEEENQSATEDQNDFGEDPNIEPIYQNTLVEVKNAEVCEQFEDEEDVDDFDLISLELEELEDKEDLKAKPDALNKTFTDLRNIVDELIACEENYVYSLDLGIVHYKSIFSDQELKKEIPFTLRGKETVIFGNIDRICDFHKDEIHPKLMTCDRNVTKICELFCDFIQKDYFYKYVLYAMNRNRSQVICSLHVDFFKARQEQIGDKLGLNSLLVKPVQHLVHLKMLFNQMIVKLLANSEESLLESLKPLIAICCKTEKHLQKLLDTVNESININDIEECNEFNILHQGKFRKMNNFEIYEKYSNYRYKGRMFLFEKCLVYTEISQKRLIYKGHIMRTKIGLEPERNFANGGQNKPKLVLFSGKLGNQCIEVTSDSSETHVIYEWKAIIEDIIRSFMIEERERVKKKHRTNRAVSLGGKPIEPLLRSISRGSVYSVKSLSSGIASVSSFSSTESDKSSDRNSKISLDSRYGALSASETENRRTTWDDRKHVERLLNAEVSFLRSFMENKSFYIDELPEEVRFRLDFFERKFDEIYWFHSQLLEEIRGCEYDVVAVAELFKTHLKLGNFGVYNNYAATLGRTKEIIGESREPISSTFYSDRMSLKDFLHLPMKNISDYLKAFNEILDESFTNGGTMNTLFKSCAIIEVEFNQLHRRVMENYRLYALNDHRIHYKTQGQVEHSELVSCNSLNVLNYKLLLTKSTLFCVHIRANLYKEKFLSILFVLPLKYLTMHESKVKPNRLKFASGETRLMHRVIFAKVEKKEAFQKLVAQSRRKILGL